MWRAATAVRDLPQGVGEYGAEMEGPDKSCSTLGRQMMLQLRLGGLGTLRSWPALAKQSAT